MVKVKMLCNTGTYRVNEEHEVDETTAERWARHRIAVVDDDGDGETPKQTKKKTAKKKTTKKVAAKKTTEDAQPADGDDTDGDE